MQSALYNRAVARYRATLGTDLRVTDPRCAADITAHSRPARVRPTCHYYAAASTPPAAG